MERLAVEFVLRASLIVLTIALVLRALRIKSAAAQHAVWTGVLFVMMLLPAWIAWGPKAGVPVLPAQPEVVTSAGPVIENAPEAAVVLETLEAPAARPLAWNWEAVFLGVYLLGAAVLLLRLAVGTIRANRLTSISCASPVTVGFLRPRIILPVCVVDWPQAQLDAVLTHEREHVHRRDPLFQWLALFNRAVFWFHPVAWWLERKLSALAEEACDDAVLERGHDPHEYSECLLELARTVQRAGTRVNVVAMAMPGGGLPQRIKTIIAGVRTQHVSRTRMACAALACAIPMAVFAAGTLDHVPQILPLLPLPARPIPQPPVLIAQASPLQVSSKPPETPPAKLEFEVATIRPSNLRTNADGRELVPIVKGGLGTSDPGQISYTGTWLPWLFMTAYGLKDSQQLLTPDWLRSERFDITAKIPAGTTPEQFNIMLQNLLLERFRVSLHHESRTLPVYALVVAKNGLKLMESGKLSGDASLPAGTAIGGKRDEQGFPILPPSYTGIVGWPSDGHVRWTGSRVVLWKMALLVRDRVEYPIVDETGLTGEYDFKLDLPLGARPGAPTSQAAGPVEASDPAPSIFEALENQLGLRLEQRKAPLDVVVIDHIEKVPTDN